MSRVTKTLFTKMKSSSSQGKKLPYNSKLSSFLNFFFILQKGFYNILEANDKKIVSRIDFLPFSLPKDMRGQKKSHANFSHLCDSQQA
jgi:hypothetical protein